MAFGWGFPDAGACCCGGAIAYHLGGHDAFSTTFYATADKTTFSDDLTAAVTTANLSQARGELAGCANPDANGYVAGGSTTTLGATVVTADKLVFSTETTAAQTTANLSQARDNLAATSERSTKGYFAGGFSTGDVASRVVTTDKLTFSSDTTGAQTTADLSQARGLHRGLSEGTTKGYFAGGATALSSGSVATADKITFSTDSTAAQTTADLTTARTDMQSMSDGSTKGYFAGGQTGIGISICDKVTFSTDTTSSQTSAATSRYNGSGSANGPLGYVAGGNDGISGASATMLKFTFSTDTNSALGGGSNLSQGRARLSGISTAAL